MIHLNLIDAAERLTAAENVAPVHVTSVADLRKKSRKKALTAALAALFVFVAFSCFLSVAGVHGRWSADFRWRYARSSGCRCRGDASRT